MDIEKIERQILQDPKNRENYDRLYVELQRVGRGLEFFPILFNILPIEKDLDEVGYDDWLSLSWHLFDAQHVTDKHNIYQRLRWILKRYTPNYLTEALEGTAAYIKDAQEMQKRKMGQVHETIEHFLPEASEEELWNDFYIYHGYAPGSGDRDTIVVVADWNDDRLRPIGEALDNIEGVETSWSDMISGCDFCQLAITTEPEHYFWTPPYFLYDSSISCLRCINDDVDNILNYLWSSGVTLIPENLSHLRLQDDSYINIGIIDKNLESAIRMRFSQEKTIDKIFFKQDQENKAYISVWLYEGDLEDLAEQFIENYEEREDPDDDLVPVGQEYLPVGIKIAGYILEKPNEYSTNFLFRAMQELT